MNTPTTYVPLTINALLAADPAVVALLGEAPRVYPIAAPRDAVYPFLVYHQLEERTISTKDGPIPDGWELMIMIHTQEPGAYMIGRKLVRVVRRALDYKTVTFLEDHHEEGEHSTLRLKYTGSEDIDDPERNNELLFIALTLRGTKIS